MALSNLALFIFLIAVELFDPGFVLPGVIKAEERSVFCILSPQPFFVFGNRAYVCVVVFLLPTAHYFS